MCKEILPPRSGNWNWCHSDQDGHGQGFEDECELGSGSIRSGQRYELVSKERSPSRWFCLGESDDGESLMSTCPLCTSQGDVQEVFSSRAEPDEDGYTASSAQPW